jgi:hypothetical protein
MLLVWAPGRNQKKRFQGGTGPLPPPFWHDYFQPTRKGGGDLTPPPKYLVLQRKLIANALQNAAKCRKMPQNAAKCRKMPQNAAKCRKTPQNAAKRRKMPQTRSQLSPIHRKMPQNAAKRPKTPENAGKHCKTPQNAAKRRKTLQNAANLANWGCLCGTKYLGGLKNPVPFSGLLKLIVDTIGGPRPPFPPENIFTGFLIHIGSHWISVHHPNC